MSTLQHIVNRTRGMYQYPYSGLDDDIRAFANSACARIAADIPKLWLLQKEYNFNTVIGTNRYTLPPGFASDKETYTIEDSSTMQLPLVSKEDYLRHVRSHRSATATGKPTSWTLWLADNELELDPTPDAVYEIAMIYFADPGELTALADSNELTNYPLTLDMIIEYVMSELYKAEERIDLAMIRNQFFMESIRRLRMQNLTKVRGQKSTLVKQRGYSSGRLRGRGY